MSRSLTLLSDQVDAREVEVVLRELEMVLQKKVEGDVVELGCYVGTTSVFLAERLKGSGRNLYLYDSFEGLPPKTKQDESPAGMQFKTGELLATKKQLIKNLKQANVPMPIIKKGWFSDLTAEDIPAKISFAFLDGDYYHSVRDSLMLIWKQLAPHATIVVDDYANEALPGAAKAVDEWLKTHPAKLQVEHSLAIIHT
jgi:O-methyltransferase